MTKLMVDDKTAGALRAMKDPVLLCDSMGRVVGRVVPPSAYDDVVVPFREEELQSAEEEAEEFSLVEILASLERK